MHVEHIQLKLEHATHMESPKNKEKGTGLKFTFIFAFFQPIRFSLIFKHNHTYSAEFFHYMALHLPHNNLHLTRWLWCELSSFTMHHDSHLS